MVPNSQSLSHLEKRGAQHPSLEEWFQTSTTHASLEEATTNKWGKEMHNDSLPHHLSFQNLTLLPFPHQKGNSAA